ncbi:hypothetical protein V5799_020056 [Amblyomma americanum]|uniref:Uncharacterized protein n=1 Tax=Amblyomma americanum TaxID=6943 RepID=A0AAQ4EUX6_AMBAM
MAEYPKSGEFAAPIYDVRPRGAMQRQGSQVAPYAPGAMQPPSQYPRYTPPGPQGFLPGGGLLAAAAPLADGAMPGGYAPSDSYYPVAGEESWDKQPKEELQRTPFFRKRVFIFEFWQLFVMWMAVSGLLVYIGGLIGFRHSEFYEEVLAHRRHRCSRAEASKRCG